MYNDPFASQQTQVPLAAVGYDAAGGGSSPMRSLLSAYLGGLARNPQNTAGNPGMGVPKASSYQVSALNAGHGPLSSGAANELMNLDMSPDNNWLESASATQLPTSPSGTGGLQRGSGMSSY